MAWAVFVLSLAGQANAAETVKVVTGHGVWDSFPTEVAVRAGIFKKHDISVEFLYSSGTGETMQAVISGAADIGEVGTLGTLAAYLKGAPLRIIGGEATGSAEFWYARAESGIKSLNDTNGKTIAYSSNGSSTHSVVRAFIQERNLSARPVATGSPAATLTTVMTGQIDVGWSSPPFGFKQIDEGQIRIIARGNDVSSVRGQTIRVIVANANALSKKRDALQRYMNGRREAVDLMYQDNSPALKYFAESNKITEEMARRMRDFFPKEMLMPEPIRGLDGLIAEGVKLKYLAAPLTKAQLDEVIQLIPPRR
jgi:NitT/TauT family transport system substrate-binding protein